MKHIPLFEVWLQHLLFQVMTTPVDDIEVEEGLEVGEELNLTPDLLPEVRNVQTLRIQSSNIK